MREEIGRTGNKGNYDSQREPLIRRYYDSMMDFGKDAKKGLADYAALQSSRLDYQLETARLFVSHWAGASSWEEVEGLCRDGWEENLTEVLEVVSNVTRLVEREMEQFEPTFAVAGGSVDVAAAVAGLPEDMIDYPLTRVSNLGTTATICCDVQCFADVVPDTIIRRGMVVVALALALEAAGHGTELWVSDEYDDGRSHVIFRTRVKGPNDCIDPAKIMFAFAHPSVQRVLGFCAVAGLPSPWHQIATRGYGHVSSLTKDDMPPETLYIEPVHRRQGADIDILVREVKMYLAQIGLLDGGPDDF
jgi:hypothetical protein